MLTVQAFITTVYYIELPRPKIEVASSNSKLNMDVYYLTLFIVPLIMQVCTALILLSKNGCIGNSYKNINHYHPTAKPGPSPSGTFHILIGKFPYFIIKFYYRAIK